MDKNNISFIVNFLKEKSGISLSSEKTYLLRSRILPAAQRLAIKDIDELVSRLRMGDRKVAETVIECMTTNETFFFRDEKVFDYVENHIIKKAPELFSGRDIRIWSAACSFGQEAYTVAMMIKHHSRYLGQMKAEIFGSDISSEALRRAKAGIYSDFEINRGLPEHYKNRFFIQSKQQGSWAIDDDIKRMVSFKYFNLMDNMTMLGMFDIVFLRNVLLYFDTPTKIDVLKRVHKQMNRNAFLILGGVETTCGLKNLYHPVPGQRGVFRVN